MLSDLKNIRIEDFDYPLPDSRIARYPASLRDHSRLLRLSGEHLSEHLFAQLPSLLPDRSLLVFNDTKVIHARLLFRKETGAAIEVFCLEPHQMALSESFEQRERCTWVCLVGNNKRWREGFLQMDLCIDGQNIQLRASRLAPVGNSWTIEFSWTGGLSFAQVIEHAGRIPLPPYMGRDAEQDDATRYQTVYARNEGSVAAPTAGLHFTPEVLSALAENGFQTEYLTLHVGAGTFKPVSTETIGSHEMHTEHVQAFASNLRHLVSHEGLPVIAVGTTSVRTLESIYWFGVQLQEEPDTPSMQISQWQPYADHPSLPSCSEAFQNVLRWMQTHHTDTLHGQTSLMIAPGYKYHTIDGLITNFHQPRSTLLLLVSALIGDRWREAYAYALQHDFRFLSYGDSCLFLSPR